MATAPEEVTLDKLRARFSDRFVELDYRACQFRNSAWQARPSRLPTALPARRVPNLHLGV